MFGFCWHTAFAEGLPDSLWEAQVQRMLRGMDARSRILFVLDAAAARTFVKRGFTTREKLLDWAYEAAQMPAGEYWDYQLACTRWRRSNRSVETSRENRRDQ